MTNNYLRTMQSVSKAAINKRNIKNKLFSAGNLCGLCGLPMEYQDANIDHKIPRSKGGANSLNNMQLTHVKCNQKKADTAWHRCCVNWRT